MAINPNTNFTAGQSLTADQQNRLPRGIVALGKRTTSDTSITAEEVEVTSSAFTAVANRYYKITYFEPELFSTATSYMQMRIRLTNISGTILCAGPVINGNGSTTFATGTLTSVETFSAGSVTLVGTLLSSAGTGQASASAANEAFILVEDIGPA